MRFEHWLYSIPLRLRSLFRRDAVERELDDELRFHLEQKTQHYVAAGLSAEEARRKALRDIEGLDTEEAARALGVSANAVKIRLHRARMALRTLIAPTFQGGAA